MPSIGMERYAIRGNARIDQCPVTGLVDLTCSATMSSRPVWIVVSTDKPTRSNLAKGWPDVTTILTGSLCTILVKLPVALFGAIGAKEVPDAGGTLSTVPRRFML